jgi:hypothetical protein
VKRIIFIVLLLLITGCAYRPLRDEFRSYSTIYVGWLDLHAGDYRKWGYMEKSEWQAAIAALNSGLHDYFRKYFDHFDIVGSDGNDRNPPKGAYYIKFVDPVIDAMQNSISTKVEIIDTNTGNIIQKFNSYATSFHASYSVYSFEGRLNNACYALAYDVHYYMTKEEVRRPPRSSGSRSRGYRPKGWDE